MYTAAVDTLGLQGSANAVDSEKLQVVCYSDEAEERRKGSLLPQSKANSNVAAQTSHSVPSRVSEMGALEPPFPGYLRIPFRRREAVIRSVPVPGGKLEA